MCVCVCVCGEGGWRWVHISPKWPIIWLLGSLPQELYFAKTGRRFEGGKAIIGASQIKGIEDH